MVNKIPYSRNKISDKAYTFQKQDANQQANMYGKILTLLLVKKMHIAWSSISLPLSYCHGIETCHVVERVKKSWCVYKFVQTFKKSKLLTSNDILSENVLWPNNFTSASILKHLLKVTSTKIFTVASFETEKKTYIVCVQ